MAQTVDQMKTDPKIYVPIQRVDDEQRMVYGYGTREDLLDSYGTHISLDSVKRCLPDYKKWRNVREMHEASAVGRADEITVDEKGVYLGVKVVDDNAWNKVKEGVYRGFSIGGKKDYQEGDVLHLKRITEFSLVDRPSNDGCGFDEFRIAQAEDDDVDRYNDNHGEDGKFTSGYGTAGTNNGENAQKYSKKAAAAKGTDEQHKMHQSAKFYHEKTATELKNNGRNEESKYHAQAAKYHGAKAQALSEKLSKRMDETEDQTNHDGQPSTGMEGGENRMKKDEKKEEPKAADVERTEILKLASEVVKRYAGEEISDAATAINALSNVSYLLEKEKGEDHPEAAAQIEQLMAVIENLKKFIASEIQEDDAEVSVTLAAGATDDVTRAGAEISKKNKEKMQAIHDHAASMGADCKSDVKKAEGSDDDVQRVKMLEAENITLKSDVTRLDGEVKAKDDEIKRLKADPAPTKGVVKVVPVSKEQDAAIQRSAQEEEDAEIKRIEGLPEDQQAVEYMKRAHQKPQVMRLMR